MTTTKKPDGYCAWHPEIGWAKDLFSSRKLFTSLKRIKEYIICGLDNSKDWQIKPVCLISPERLEELENYEFMYKGLEK